MAADVELLQATALFFSLADDQVEANHAVLVAGADYRDVLAGVVLALINLLGGLRNILAVGQREVVNNLLLDGDLRAPGGVGFGVKALGIDFDFADPQQLLHTIAHGGIERFTQDEVRSGLAEGGVSRLRELRGLFAGLADRQQGDDVGFGQRWIGAVFHAERLAGIAVDADGGVVDAPR